MPSDLRSRTIPISCRNVHLTAPASVAHHALSYDIPTCAEPDRLWIPSLVRKAGTTLDIRHSTFLKQMTSALKKPHKWADRASAPLLARKRPERMLILTNIKGNLAPRTLCQQSVQHWVSETAIFLLQGFHRAERQSTFARQRSLHNQCGA